MYILLTIATFFIALTQQQCLNTCGGGNGKDRITKLPGYSGPTLTQYSGFIPVNHTANGSLFYWFIESQRNPQTAPVLVWINGGPGASSLTGLMAENGPFRIKPNTSATELEYHQYAWTEYYNMLFVDNPIGTGFSYCNKGQWVVNEDQMAAQFVEFLDTFFSRSCHSAFASNGLYITGESYAGRYIPYIGQEILKKTREYTLKGLAIGNGIYDPYIQFYSSAHYAHNLGIIDDEQRDYVLDQVSQCMPIPPNTTNLNCSQRALLCETATNNIYNKTMGNVFQYNVYELDPNKFNAISDDIATYLAQPAVVSAIHTCGIPFKDSDGTSSPNPVSDALLCDIVYNNSAQFVPEILDKGVRILFYNGQLDGSICNNRGNSECLNQLNYGGNWYDVQKVPFLTRESKNDPYLTAGYAKESGRLTYFVVSDSGHLVPYDQPYNILAVINNWIDGGSWNVKYQL